MSIALSPVRNLPFAFRSAPGRHAALSDSVLPELDQSRPPWPGEFVDADGLSLHVRHTPGPVDGPVAGAESVYVHGLGGSATNWTDLAAQLGTHSAGHAVDLPGFGRTRPPEGYPFTLRAQADAVVRLIRSLGDRPVHLFGNSMGGATAIIVAAEHPELVRTLTLVSPAVPDLRPDPRRMSDPRMALAMLPVLGRNARRQLAAAGPRARAEAVMRLCFADLEQVLEHRLAEATDEVRERMGMPWAGTALERATLNLFRSWLVPYRRSLWRMLPQISAPTLVVWGVQDRLVTVRKARRTAAALPDGRLLVLARTGHVAQMERPVTVARAVLGMWESVAGISVAGRA